MFYSDVIDMLCLYIQQSLFDLLQNSINELLGLCVHQNSSQIYVLVTVVLLTIDSDVGAACATGDGDEIMKHCPCYRVVQLMSSEASLSPTDACTTVVRDICERGRRRGQAMFNLGLIALNMKVLETC